MENVAEKLSNLSTEDTFRTKAKAMAMLLLDECYNTASSDAATFSQKVEFLKTAAKLGDLEPRQQNPALAAQVGFSIKVVYNDPPASPQTGETVDAETVVAVGAKPPEIAGSTSGDEPDWLSTLPEYINPKTLWRTRTLAGLIEVGAKPE